MLPIAPAGNRLGQDAAHKQWQEKLELLKKDSRQYLERYGQPACQSDADSDV
jgi:hypothetical protein